VNDSIGGCDIVDISSIVIWTASVPTPPPVTATGSDGCGVVYSMGEIDPTHRAGNVALVAYDDETGTFPSIAAVADCSEPTARHQRRPQRLQSGDVGRHQCIVQLCPPGKRIATPDGAIPVEQLRISNLVMTVSGRTPGPVDCQRRIDLYRPRALVPFQAGLQRGYPSDGGRRLLPSLLCHAGVGLHFVHPSPRLHIIALGAHHHRHTPVPALRQVRTVFLSAIVGMRGVLVV
jgi:hypothetical protein